jgi:hypothetical protein
MTEKEQILELYKTFVETITANEQRRQALSAFYTSLIAAGGAASNSSAFDSELLALAILIVSLIWLVSVRYFRRLAWAKFAVIHEMESHFALRPFEREWQYFTTTTDAKRRLVPRRWSRWTLTHFDQVIPSLTAAASLCYLLYRHWPGAAHPFA